MWPANNCLQIIVCSCVIVTPLLCEKFLIASLSRDLIWKQTRRRINKTIIELGYRKISWFASVSQINNLPKPWGTAILKEINRSARHWQITFFLLTLVQYWIVQYFHYWRCARENEVFHIIIWSCLTRTGSYQIHEFDWLKSILKALMFCSEQV